VKTYFLKIMTLVVTQAKDLNKKGAGTKPSDMIKVISVNLCYW